jgi:hypothetical protein
MFDQKIKWVNNTLYYIVNTNTIIELVKIQEFKNGDWGLIHSPIYQTGISIIFYNIKYANSKEMLMLEINTALLSFSNLFVKNFH